MSTAATMNETERPQATSEDEGKDRVRNAFRRGVEGARGLSYARRHHVDPETPGAELKRPGHRRRMTAFEGSMPFRLRADRQASSSALRWRQVKAGIKAMGQRKREEHSRVDHQKSAQLMAEMLAGAPAALMFASMFQRDENGHRKVPVLLEQLKVRIPHSETRQDSQGDRHLIFKIDLEYGNGPTRTHWQIRRTLQDFVNLHVKYKTQAAADKFRHLRGEDKTKVKMPRFPRSAFPFARGVRGLFDKLQDEEEEEEPDVVTPGEQPRRQSETPGPSTIPENERPSLHRRRKSSFAPPTRTGTSDTLSGAHVDPKKQEVYQERQRRKLEAYLQGMINWLIFRADSTRLCKFLELSALAIRLSTEGGYQGKQGLLNIVSRRHRELGRKALMLGLAKEAAGGFQDRHKSRWFLVRQSYIICVDGPESLVPYDVFLVDSDFRTEKRTKKAIQPKSDSTDLVTADSTIGAKHHVIRLYNSERKMKLVAKTERQFVQFQESIKKMVDETVWVKKQRFGSFAPVRHNVWARWLVDGRDHMWQVSRAIDCAKDFVYIHDWWLSPELYLRRPAAISQTWRLDRLLQRKAQEGVKIFVIVYRNIESAIPIDSEYTKWSLLDLHENICVQRSPNQFRQNQFFWAHHEKLVVVDNMMAFVGGVDLCFGRWDDPGHSLTDDKLTGFELNLDVPRDSEHCQVWPGKDYSNPRVQDFYALDRPYEEMYDRTKVPRMPWHDIAMQMIGQPARDVGRHFVQRWNYILRSRVPSRPTPVLIPPPEYDPAELKRLGMTGTCQIQVLRSAAAWSIGTPNKTEHSIMNAYVHLIRTSDHYVYIENQFFISSCTVEGSTIHNTIGDALVERAIQAYENGDDWQACIIIPLMPGFQNEVDSQDGTSIRLIMQCQYRSICRGETSIFGRLRTRGIEPEDYIRFFSLRQWGKIGPRKSLTTEQLYIHAKCMIVDDRHAIIGSANINERSLLGNRDSEVATVITDTQMIPSFMAGKPYDVGEFPHTLRKRLMREHLGIDVDTLYRLEQARQEKEREMQDREMARIYRSEANDYFSSPHQSPDFPIQQSHLAVGEKQPVQASTSANSSSPDLAPVATGGEKDREHDVEGYGVDNMKALAEAGDKGFTDSYVDRRGRETLLKKDAPDFERIKKLEKGMIEQIREESVERQAELPPRPPWPTTRSDTFQLGLVNRSQLPDLPDLDDTDIGGPPLTRGVSNTSTKVTNPLLASIRRPEVHEDCMTDPLAPGFYQDIWHAVAENNTKIYRQVFHIMPDSEVRDWKAYAEFNALNEAFMHSQGLGNSKPAVPRDAPAKSGPPGSVATVNEAASIVSSKELEHVKSKEYKEPTHPPMPTLAEKPTHNGDIELSYLSEKPQEEKLHLDPTRSTDRKISFVDLKDGKERPSDPTEGNSEGSTLQPSTSQRRRRRATTKSSRPTFNPAEEILGKEEAEGLLKLVQGHLVVWPYDWLEKEERGSNWLYNIDQLAPLEIYD
ncbi:phospholipase D [Piedraia hortae CBS 480.64]|uniref:Phospholipase n=1 Tax=Piedraia hortae CBS 480.64 TaxID=1314780 RepID=A0A6A7C894_9PEZI|nr:phospholipase D [Piedraia hortae CBS 480.64]